MKKIVYNIASCVAVISIFSINSKQVQAFQPASHYALLQKVEKNLPSNSIIGQAIREYSNVAAWGSIAPDLGYFQPSQLGGYAPWADRYHYYKVGSFAESQLKEALDSGDKKKIAFAAGWVSHISGDLACHGIYVNPECGVYLDNEDTRSQHSELEKMAEPYVWNTLGNQNQSLYENKKLANIYSETGSIPFDLVNEISEKIYKTSASVSEEKRWCDVLLTGLNTGIGYTYTDYNKSLNYLNQSGNLAFDVAKELINQGNEVKDIILLDSRFRTEVQEHVMTKEEWKQALYDKYDLEKYEETEMLVSDYSVDMIMTYLMYVDCSKTTGTVDANITFINSEKEFDDARMFKWKEATTREFKIVQGFGTHYQMITTNNRSVTQKEIDIIKNNADIVREVLNR